MTDRKTLVDYEARDEGLAAHVEKRKLAFSGK